MTTSDGSMIIHLYSGPRSLSTALLYSFAQRTDTKVVDEPLYASWLYRNPNVFRPYREELLSTTPNLDANEVLKSIYQEYQKPFYFLKHIVKQFSGSNIDKSLLYDGRARHVFLIRDPFEMITSWNKKTEIHHESCTLENMGFLHLAELYSDLRQHAVHKPVVLDSDWLAQSPEIALQLLCSSLNIPYMHHQLHWLPGPKPEIDGLWAKYWYDTVQKTTGFSEDYKNAKYRLLQGEYLELYRESLPFHQLLKRKALGSDPLNPGSSQDPAIYGHSSSSHSRYDDYSSMGMVMDHGFEHNFKLADPRNEDIVVWIGQGLVPRELAKVSVFDSSVQGGDAVWEGIRVYEGKIFKLEEHLHRLMDSAKALAFKNIPTVEFIREALFKTLAANGMTHQAHIRLTLSRGPKITSSMNPLFNIFGPTLMIVPEWKPVGDQTTYDNHRGIKLITATNRRNPAQCIDSKIHHNNLINNILPKIQANNAGAADALMLDLEGFVSETNATNIFLVKNGIVLTPTADSCLPGITRKTVIEICQRINQPIIERRISLAEFHTADEVFTTGTMGELTPVNEIDGRQIGVGNAYPGPITRLIQHEFRTLTEVEGVILPFV